MTALKNSKADVINNRIDQVNQPLKVGSFTLAERDAIPNAEEGLMAFVPDEFALFIFINDGWARVAVF